MWGTALGRGSRGPVGAAHGLGKGQGRRQTTSSTSRGYGATRTPGEHGTQNVASLSDTDPRPGESLAHGAARGPGSCTDVAGPHPGQQPPPARSTEREGAGRPWLHRPAGRQPHHGHVHDTDTERDSHMLSQKETGDCSDTALRTACYAWAAGGRGRLQFMAGGAAAGRRPVLSSQLLWPN